MLGTTTSGVTTGKSGIGTVMDDRSDLIEVYDSDGVSVSVRVIVIAGSSGDDAGVGGGSRPSSTSSASAFASSRSLSQIVDRLLPGISGSGLGCTHGSPTVTLPARRGAGDPMAAVMAFGPVQFAGVQHDLLAFENENDGLRGFVGSFGVGVGCWFVDIVVGNDTVMARKGKKTRKISPVLQRTFTNGGAT
jgi:hypothetical protein